MKYKEKIEKAVKEIDLQYKKEFKNFFYSQRVKIWEKGEKFRIYVPRNSYEQAGYVTIDSDDIHDRNSGEHLGFYYQATRPGNVNSLLSFIELLSKKMKED